MKRTTTVRLVQVIPLTELAPSRRTLVRGAAWSVPVVAVAATAPAYAASPCGTTYTWKLDWGVTAYTKNSKTNVGTATVGNVSGTLPITVTFTSTVTAGVTRHPTNLDLENGISDVGDLGAGEQGLELWHSSTTNSDDSYQTVVITFSRQVSDLAFTITDIDYDYGAFSDRVALSGDRVGTRATNNVTGSGSYDDPWRPSFWNAVTARDTGDNRGNVSVRYNSPVSSIELRYWNRGGSGQQAIWISDMTWKALGC